MFSRPTLEAFRRIVPVVVFRRGFLYECRIGFFKSVCVCVLRQQKKTICQAHYIRFFKLHPLKCRKKKKSSHHPEIVVRARDRDDKTTYVGLGDELNCGSYQFLTV